MKSIKLTRQFSNEMMDKFRQMGDPKADEVIDELFKTEGITSVREMFKWLNTSESTSSFGVINDFIGQNQSLPDFANKKLMQQGTQFFAKNQNAIGIMLACYSLPYCYAGADGAKVLAMSQRIQTDTLKRLEETGEFLQIVTKEENWHNGEAVCKILKVRLMHAAIRFFTEHHGKWDLAWGKPVNQEDMAGTNGAFSYIVIRGMRKAGDAPSDADAEAYLHLWNVISVIMGVDKALIPDNLREAFTMDKAIAKRQFKPSEEGKALTKALLETIEKFIENPLLKTFPAAQMRFLMGDSVADILGIPQVSFEKKLIPLIPTSVLFGQAPPKELRG
ncbi:MAG: oxygenase MpaB family protein [Arcicella sp.]|nr:oxygenase MpaB family protein [Arcicella sp.]